MTTQMETPMDTEKFWHKYRDDLLNAIELGFLDRDLKTIAEACVARNKAVKTGLADSASSAGVMPPGHVWAQHEEDGAGLVPVPAKPKPSASRKLRRRGQRSASTSDEFRYTDGRLYYKSDVRGKTIPHHLYKGATIYAKVVGVGPKSAKVVFVHGNGDEVTDPQCLPVKYRDNESKSAKTGIKDPIFMGLSVIEPIIKTLTPIQEK